MNQGLALDSKIEQLQDEKNLTDDTRAVVDWTLNHSLDTDSYCVPDGVVRMS